MLPGTFPYAMTDVSLPKLNIKNNDEVVPIETCASIARNIRYGFASASEGQTGFVAPTIGM